MLLFLVTPCLVKTVQPCMKWIPTFKKWPPTTYLIPNDKKTLTKCHKYKRCILLYTCTKPVACALVCAHVITHIKWWRLIKVWFSLSSSVYLWGHCYVKVCSVFVYVKVCSTLFCRIMMLNAVIIYLSLLENTFYWMIIINCRGVLSPTWKANSHVKWHNLSPGKAFSPT